MVVVTGRDALAPQAPDALWEALNAAAAGGPGDAARLVARLCTSAGTPRLGWVRPAPWHVVRTSLEQVRSALARPALARPGAAGLLLLGTGGWSFAALALCELPVVRTPPGGGAQRSRLAVLDSLEPTRIQRALRRLGGAPDGILAVSGSGGTLETRLLAEVIPTLTGGRAGPAVWLRDTATAPGVHPLSPRRVADQTAMLGAPLSIPFLLAAATVDSGALPGAYARLVRQHGELGRHAALLAAAMPVRGRPRLLIIAPAWAGTGLRRWLLQLGRQILCGKSAAFRPDVDVAGPDVRRDDADAVLDLGAQPAELGGLMTIMYLAGVTVACLALRAGLDVTEHLHVRAYKKLLDAADPPPDPPAVTMQELPTLAATWLAVRPDLTRLHVVGYGPAALSAPAFAAATGLPCEAHEGSAWNHHSFQAVYADPRTAVLVVTGPPGTRAATGGWGAAAAAQQRIAEATWGALASRSRLVHLPDSATKGGPGCRSPR